MPDYAGFGTDSTDRGVAAGLTIRPIADTITDTLEWVGRNGRASTPKDFGNIMGEAGLSIEREAELLRMWAGLSS